MGVPMARMTSRLSALTIMGLCCCVASAAAQQVIAPAAPPARIIRSERRVEVAPDGSSTIMSHISHWTTDSSSVSVHRELSARFDQPLCSDAAKDELRECLRMTGAVIIGR